MSLRGIFSLIFAHSSLDLSFLLLVYRFVGNLKWNFWGTFFKMLSKSLAAVALLATNAAATIYYAGVAESSGEFGVWSQTSTKGTGLPGVFGRDYSFISKAAIDTYVDQNKVNQFLLLPHPQKATREI